ncbi:lipopolysaccharide biosynthesis protein [Burkholderia cenocepacia]|uniref:lipopolysaccharide biosynthesis protein n=1 Tax=Burkholderia cenocepacia TaxID=95486 RepID=UPI002AB70D02|nr:oligosaccharide flippase family protein [Burkholderia cenocepacia]
MLIRLFLRFAALGLKFGLAIVVARTLGFDAVAAYGLAVAASVIASKVLGLGFSTELNRRLSAHDPLRAIGDARALCGAYSGLYLLLALALGTATLLGATIDLAGLPAYLPWCVLLVALSEHAAFEANSWMFSLHRPRAASLLLFVRTGAWAGLASAGLLAGMLRSIEAVFALWFASNALVVVLSWRGIAAIARRARRDALPARTPERRSLLAIWRRGLPFYLAAVLLSMLQYAERFIAGSLTSADVLGRYVFAWSIANAVQTIAFATVAATAGPAFVRTLADDPHGFRAQLRRALIASAALTMLAAAAILIMRGEVFRLAHEPAGPREVAVLAVLLASFALRAVADVLWTAMIALRAGIAVMVSMAAVAAVCMPAAWGLIGRFGIVGAALAHLTASIGIVAALALIVARRTAHGRAVTSREEATHAA